MTVLILFFRGELRERFLQDREVEDRIVAESSRTARRFQYFSVYVIRNHCDCSSFFRQRNCANKIRSTLVSRLISQFAKKFFNPLLICRFQSRISRGLNPGSTPK